MSGTGHDPGPDPPDPPGTGQAHGANSAASPDQQTPSGTSGAPVVSAPDFQLSPSGNTGAPILSAPDSQRSPSGNTGAPVVRAPDSQNIPLKGQTSSPGETSGAPISSASDFRVSSPRQQSLASGDTTGTSVGDAAGSQQSNATTVQMSAWMAEYPKNQQAKNKTKLALRLRDATNPQVRPPTKSKGFRLLEDDPVWLKNVLRDPILRPMMPPQEKERFEEKLRLAGVRPSPEIKAPILKSAPIHALPENLRDMKVPALYPDHLPCDTSKRFPMEEVFKHRGQDTPTYKSQAGSQGFNLKKDALVMIHINDANIPMDSNLYEWPQHKVDAVNGHKKCVKLSYRLHTQYPSIALEIDRGTIDHVVFEIFGNALWRSDWCDDIGLSFEGGTCGALDETTLPDDSNVKKLQSTGNLWRTRLKLHDPENLSVTRCKTQAVWHGIDPAELARIQGTTPTAATPYWERIVYALSASRSFSLLRAYTADWTQVKPFCHYFRGAMYGVACYGHWWWYSLVTGRAITDEEFPFPEEVPRWLVMEFSLHYESYSVTKSNRFSPLNPEFCPDPNTAKFAHRWSLWPNTDVA